MLCSQPHYADVVVVKKLSSAGDTDPTYQEPSTIPHTPHPITGVIYADINLETKKKVQRLIVMYAGPIKYATSPHYTCITLNIYQYTQHAVSQCNIHVYTSCGVKWTCGMFS